VSDFDAAIADADDALFEAFGTDATVSRGAEPAVDVRVVVTRGVARYGEYGQVVGRVTTVDFRIAQWLPRPGDVLHLPEGDRKVQGLDADDGRVARAVLHG
jgi:hypothetical protein